MTAIVLYIAHVALFFFLGKKYGKEITTGLKGKNDKWDAPEVVVGLWIILFPAMILANLFLDYEINTGLLASMDLILAAALGGRGIIDYVNKKDDHKGNSK